MQAERNAPGKCDTDLHECQGGLLKTDVHKKGTLNHQLQLCNLTDEFGKIGHAHQKCALPSEKP